MTALQALFLISGSALHRNEAGIIRILPSRPYLHKKGQEKGKKADERKSQYQLFEINLIWNPLWRSMMAALAVLFT